MNEQTDLGSNVAQRCKIKIFIVVASLLLLTLWIASVLPCLFGSGQAKRETLALQTVKLINAAQQKYAKSKGSGKYADLQTLTVEALIDVTLAGRGSDYIFTSTPVEGGDKPMYDTTARPTSTGTWGAGNRSFYSNETQAIYDVDGGNPPTATPQNRIPADGYPLVP
jgi:type II secretory pathway pseudopilin PulG